MATLHFLYSAEQYNIRKQIENKLGKIYIPGKVNVNGIQKEYTDIVDDLSRTRYSDTVLVASIDKSLAKYTKYE